MLLISSVLYTIGLTLLPLLQSGDGLGSLHGKKTGGGAQYRVMLVDSPSHTEQLCAQVIPRVVPGVDENHAVNCFRTARELGLAIVTVCIKEHAEFYAMQMYRSGCRSRVEPDTATI